MTTLKTRCIDNEGSRYTAAPIPPLPALISPLTGPRTPPLSPRIRGRSAFQSHRAECASLGKRKKLSPEMPMAVAKALFTSKISASSPGRSFGLLCLTGFFMELCQERHPVIRVIQYMRDRMTPHTSG